MEVECKQFHRAEERELLNWMNLGKQRTREEEAINQEVKKNHLDPRLTLNLHMPWAKIQEFYQRTEGLRFEWRFQMLHIMW